MKIICIKSRDDSKSFKTFRTLGFDIYNIDNLEDTDQNIAELVNKRYDTILVSNEVASFSEDIIKKYSKDDKINIIITPRKE